MPYLKIGTFYGLHYRLILSRTQGFYSVFHILYRSKSNGLAEFWVKLKLSDPLSPPKMPYLKIGISYRLPCRLILIRTQGFYLVFHILYRSKSNGLAEFLKKPKLFNRPLFTTKMQYLKIGTCYSLHYRLILSRTQGFYLVFHISYRSKSDGLAEFWPKRFSIFTLFTTKNSKSAKNANVVLYEHLS